MYNNVLLLFSFTSLPNTSVTLRRFLSIIFSSIEVGVGSVNTEDVVTKHPAASVIVTEYVPAIRLYMLSVIDPLSHE